MKFATLAFVLLLVTVHLTGDTPELLAQPLSMLRDGTEPAIGYTLFGLLLVIAGFMMAASIRARRELDVAVFCLAGFLLVIVAVTPTEGAFHNLFALLLPGLIYGYFAILVWCSGSVWRFVLLPAPVLLVFATGFHSYGLWQKLLIVYLVLLVNIHYHLVSRSSPVPVRRTRSGRSQTRQKRGVVYTLSPGKAWRRLPRAT
jgi:hypothetical protein